MKKEPYIPSVWEQVNCMFCGSGDNRLYQKFGNNLQYSYVLCNTCSLVYQSPRPKYDDDFLEAAYGKYFLFDPDYQYNVKELEAFRQELDEIVKFDLNKTSLLEIGSAMGAFLKVSKDYYDSVTGLEISDVMAEFVRNTLGVKVYKQKFEHWETNRKFSCIHMSHVIGYIPNPKEWLDKSRELLEPDGVLVIAVPNMFSFSRLFKLMLQKIGLRSGKWKEDWRTPDHLFEPTVKSMLRFLKSNNFKILDYYSYSRKNMTSKGWVSKIFNRKLYFGSNLRFYAKVQSR